jgi:hypothetical protein
MALDEGALDPFKLLEAMRNQRANLVDNAVLERTSPLSTFINFHKYTFQQQYEFVHLVLLEILVVPQFSVSCGDFPSTFNILMVRYVLFCNNVT